MPALRRKALPGPDATPAPAALLAWYDRHRRVLPWRALPGEAADPYRVWLSEIMLQQTTVKAVIPYWADFVSRWPHVGALAAASREDVLRAWAGLGYYARARNLHACAQVVAEDYAGRFPDSEAALRRLPGIGAYTAAAVAAIAFGARAAPVDGNIERVVARLYAVAEALPAAKPRIRALAEALTPQQRPGDHAQAMMDLGATICTPRKPACALCPFRGFCAAERLQQQEDYPRKPARKAGALRRGAAFVLTRADGAVLVRSRAPQGLLGGMTEVPGSDWSATFDDDAALAQAPRLAGRRTPQWRRVPGLVAHVFTHFRLELAIYTAGAPLSASAPAGMRFAAAAELHGEALPSLMRKVIAHAEAAMAHPASPTRLRTAIARAQRL